MNCLGAFASAMEGHHQQIDQGPQGVHHRGASFDAEQAVEPNPQTVEYTLGRGTSGWTEIVGVIVGQIQVSEPGLDQSGCQPGWGAKGVTVAAGDQRFRRLARWPAP